MSDQNAGDAPKLSATQSPEEFREGVNGILAERREFALTCQSEVGRADDGTAAFNEDVGAAFDAVWAGPVSQSAELDFDHLLMTLPSNLWADLGLVPGFLAVLTVDHLAASKLRIVDSNAEQCEGRVGRATQPIKGGNGTFTLSGSGGPMQWGEPSPYAGVGLRAFAENFPKEMGLEEQLRFPMSGLSTGDPFKTLPENLQKALGLAEPADLVEWTAFTQSNAARGLIPPE